MIFVNIFICTVPNQLIFEMQYVLFRAFFAVIYASILSTTML